MFGHMTDVGGAVPGSLPTQARQIYEEGILIPPVKVYKKGERQDDLLNLIFHQCRLPHLNRADLDGIFASVRTAERRILDMCDRFGVDTYVKAVDMLLERNRRAMEQLIITTVPEEKIYFEDYVCDDGIGMGPYKIALTLWREGNKAIFDFEGTDPQSEGSINFYLSEAMFKMFVGTYMVNVFDPQILFNDGFYDHVEVHIPEGTLLKPVKPAALSCRTHALGRIFDVIGATVGQRAPDFLIAAGFSDSPHLMYSGYDKNGEWYQLYQIGFGGIPGKPFGDGPDAHSLWPAFTNVPNEFLENYVPVRMEINETIPDTGGPGFFRGGNGAKLGYRFLEPGEVSIHDDRWLTYPYGVNGGLPGGRSWKKLIRKDGTEEIVSSKCDHVKVEEGDLLLFCTWGGGGWGDPYKRDANKVAQEVRRGLVTPEGAKRYGVVLTEDLTADEKATEQLRARLSAERGEPKMFNRGFDSIEELKARCLEETGLPPPEAPVFPEHILRMYERKLAAEKTPVAADD
jgi:N-methylhydantoinase B